MVREDGKSQILLKLTIREHHRPRMKTGIFVLPKFFKAVKTSKRGSSYDIVIPQSGKRNAFEVNEARDAKFALDELINRIYKICWAGSELVEVNKEWIERILALLDANNIPTSQITSEVIRKLEFGMKVNKSSAVTANAYGKPKDFPEAIRRYYSFKDLSQLRKKSYEDLIGMVERFELYTQLMKDKNYHFDYDTITKHDIEAFKEYLIDEYKLAELYPKTFEEINEKIFQLEKRRCRIPAQRGGNYMCTIMKRLVAVFNWLYDSEFTTNQPMRGVYKGQETYGSPIYITLEERNKIAAFDFSYDTKLETQRDIFIFQCLVGCRVGDLTHLTEDFITDNVLEYVPNKTAKGSGVKARVPLCKQAQELIDKYRGKDPRGRLFPFIDDRQYNNSIKDIFKAAGITRIVQYRNPTTGKYEPKSIADIASSHMARRTFVGTAYQVVKDPNIIGKMSGHVEGSKAFTRYRTIDDNLLQEVIEAIS